MSLAQSILLGDTAPMGYRSDVCAAELNGTGSRPGLSVIVNERQQDIVQIWVTGNSQSFVRCQLLFDNPKESQRINRPLSRTAQALLTMLTTVKIRAEPVRGMVDVIEVLLPKYQGPRILLDPYVAVMNGEVI